MLFKKIDILPMGPSGFDIVISSKILHMHVSVMEDVFCGLDVMVHIS